MEARAAVSSVTPDEANEYELLSTEEFDFVETKEIDSNDYKRYDNAGHRILTPDYVPKEVDQAIYRLYSEQYDFVESHEHKDFAFAYHLFEDKTQNTTIVLFDTVANNKENRMSLISLDDALKFYKNSPLHNMTDKVKVIIPVGEEFYTRHFRLLTLVENKYCYYDSKSPFISELMRRYDPFYLATSTAFKEIQKKVKDQKNETVFGYVQQFGVFAREAFYNYLAYFDQVKQICNKHDPKIPVERYALSHQPYDQHTDCGLYTIFYAIKIAQGLPPDDIKEEINKFFASLSRQENREEEPKVTLYERPTFTIR